MRASDDATIPGDSSTPPVGTRPIHRGDVLGRYVVVGELGRGGMAVVLAAYDPELDRKVAVKVVRTQSDSLDRSALLREAQALAKLNHPNVVAVHDVGTFADGVWIAMEFVDGPTLTAWADHERRSWREVLDVLEPALVGLVAAHAVGITHRDFKPGNVMIGSDGRVRVLDFGLAHTSAASTVASDAAEPPPRSRASHRWIGTPGYMAPEQLRGDPVDERCDQFAFCVSLWELVHGVHPFAGESMPERAAAVLDGRRRPPPRERAMPAWLRSVCDRGLAPDPARRFENSAAMLAALARGHARARWRRVAGGFAALGLVAIAVLVVRHREHEARRQDCREQAAEIDAVWNDDARRQLQEHALASGASLTAEKIAPWIDAYALQWRDTAAATCLAVIDGPGLDPALHERATWCLAERRFELEALIGQLEHGEREVITHGVIAAARLSDLRPCGDAAMLADLPSPPSPAARDVVEDVRRELATVRVQQLTGRSAAGREAILGIRARAEGLGDPHLLASVLRLEASLRRDLGDYAQAEVTGLEAYAHAVRAAAWEEAALAAEGLAFTIGHHQARPDEGAAWLLHAELAAHHAGDPIGQHEMARLSGRGALALDTGRLDAARQYYEGALALQEASLGLEHPALDSTLNNLAIVHVEAGRLLEGAATFERALALRISALGEDHPDVGGALGNLGVVRALQGDPAEAVRLHQRALALYEAAYGPEHLEVAASLGNLAGAMQALGENESARGVHERALGIQERRLGPEHPIVARSLSNLAVAELRTGAVDAAQRHLERALAIRERRLGPQHRSVADALVNLADVDEEIGARARRVRRLARAVAIYEAQEGVPEGEAKARLAHANAWLDAIAHGDAPDPLPP